ncbi:MAG: exo-alpha-sialidase [candidate division KSB1 bacterium]|nr:exo-alpha-sialidase [candidate division KSB1 bacterium]
MRLITLLIVLFSGLTFLEMDQPNSKTEPQQPLYSWNFVCFPTEERPSCHASTIVELPDGDLLAAWYAGTREMAQDVAILIARLKKGVDTWSEPVVVADTPEKSEGNPVLWLDPRNKLWLFYVTMYGSDWTTCKVKYIQSDDFGHTWGPEHILREQPGWMTRNKPLILNNGDILLPLYDERTWESLFMYSTDGGQTWQHTENLPSSPGNIQPAPAQLSDGSIIAFMRTGKAGYLWKSSSEDNGRTWSKPELTNIKNPNSACDLVRLKNGHLVLVFNDSQENRNKLAVALSEDEGQTWRYKKYLENAPFEFSYPAIIQTQDGLIHVTYTYKRTHIKHVVFNESWLRLLFSDDFEDGKAEGWQPNIPEHWQVAQEEGSMVYQLIAPGQEGAVRAPTSWSVIKDFDVTNFVFTVRAKCYADTAIKNRDVAIFFHYQDATHFYYVHFSANSDQVHNIIGLVNGRDRVKINQEPPGQSLPRLVDQKFHHFKVSYDARTGQIKAYLDDMTNPILTAQDTTLTHGLVGVGSFDDTGSFDDIKLWGEIYEP